MCFDRSHHLLLCGATGYTQFNESKKEGNLLFSEVTVQLYFPRKLSNGHGHDARRLEKNISFEHNSFNDMLQL